MARALLLLPTATYRASAFLEAAERLGVDVVVGSERHQALEEAMGDRFVFVPLNRPSEAADAIVRYARRQPLDAVVAVDDQGALTAAIACERLGLRNSPPGAVAATRDKASMRELLHRAGVPQPEYRLAGGVNPSAADAGTRIGWPVVLKPRTLSASRGVIRADDPEAAELAYRRIQGILAAAGEIDTSTVLVEELVAGPEVALEGLVRAGRLEVLAVFDKPDQGDGPYFEESIYVTPSRLPASTLDAIRATAGAAVAALGISDGPVHAELRAGVGAGEGDGAGSGAEAGGAGPVMIEIAARTIGGRCSKALTFGAGTTLEELVLAHALDLGLPSVQRSGAASGVMMIPIPATGTLEGVDGVDVAAGVPGIWGVEIAMHPGAHIEQLPEGDRYLGFVFAAGETPEEVESALREAHAALRIRITPPVR